MLNYQILHTDALEDTLNTNGYRLLKFEPFGLQINNCQAWEIDGEVEDMTTGEVLHVDILQSYNTLVAYRLNGAVTRCGKWSTTTSKQTTTWERLRA